MLRSILEADPEFSGVLEEEWISGVAGARRKPDIAAVRAGLAVHFEIQVSSLFFSDSFSRHTFSLENDAQIMWLFSSELTAQNYRSFKDLSFWSRFNVHVFDEEAHAASLEAGSLIVKTGIGDFDSSGRLTGFHFKLVPFAALHRDCETNSFYLECGYRKQTAVLLRKSRSDVRDFRAAFRDHRNSDEWLTPLRALLTTSGFQIEPYRLHMLLVAGETLRTGSRHCAVGYDTNGQDIFWALDRALHKDPTASYWKSLQKMIEHYDPDLLHAKRRDGAMQGAIKRLLALQTSEPDLQANRVLRLLYPEALAGERFF